jgi:hypothetical protein
MHELQPLVDAGDPAALLVAVDRLAASRDWAALADLARRCRDAVEMGRQLWPVAMHIDYRLAWEGPPEYAGSVLRPGAGKFALGPLTEVAASTHDWDALAPHIGDPASAAAVAQERVIRGEDLRGRAAPAELPLHAQPWEPAYALPRYRDRSAAFPPPEVAVRPLPAPRHLPPGRALADDEAVDALEGTVETWIAQSSGEVRAVLVEGAAADAVGTLVESADPPPHVVEAALPGASDPGGAPGAALLAVAPAEALALLQWTGANGGAYGRRPGGARGRFAAWFAAAALTGLPWPPDPDELGAAIHELRWYRWAPAVAETGWVLRLAAEDPVDGLAWAVDATDRREDEDEDASPPAASPGWR